MLRLEDCRLIGRIGKPHGHAGAVKLELLPDLETDLNINEPVFLIIEGKPVPFYMEECNEAAHPPILHFEDLKSIDQARKLTGFEVFAPKEDVDAETDWVA
ncbi:MAG: ribosome maturation factor RimM [Bacteroidia bacterium]